MKKDKGSGIHIKEKNEGKFTEWAKRHGMGVQEAARHVLANKDKYSSTIVKRANFARNASKFKHKEGGETYIPAYAPGGMSTMGYRADSPDRFNAFNIIPSNTITMRNVPHPVMGMDDRGTTQMMYPGSNYVFPGRSVFEVPVRRYGGGINRDRPTFQTGGTAAPVTYTPSKSIPTVPGTEGEQPTFNYSKNPDLDRLVFVTDIANNLIGSGTNQPLRQYGQDKLFYTDGTIPGTDAPITKLFDSIYIFNQRPDVKKLTPEQRIDMYYNSLYSGDKDVQAFKSKVKTLGYGTTEFFRNSPNVLTQAMLGEPRLKMYQAHASNPAPSATSQPNSYQLGGQEDNTGFIGSGNINPWNANSYFTDVPAAVTPGTMMPRLQPIGTPVVGMAGRYPTVSPVTPPFQRPAPGSTMPSIQQIGTHSIADKFPTVSPVTPSFQFTNTNTANQTDASTSSKNPGKKNKWWRNLDYPGTILSLMGATNTAIESYNRNSRRDRALQLGDNVGSVQQGSRGVYEMNNGYDFTDQRTPVQFGAAPVARAQMGGGYYDAPAELEPIPEGPLPSIPASDPYANIDTNTDKSSHASIPDIKPNERVRPNDAAWDAYNYYINEKGLAPHMAAGIVGNLYQESGVQASAREKASAEQEKQGYIAKGKGVGQWSEDGRWQALVQWAEKNKRDPNDLYAQLDFILEEPGEGLKAMKAMAQARTPEEASYAFGKTYERPSDKYARWDVRAGIARKLYEGSLPRMGNNVAQRNVRATNAAKFGGEMKFQQGGEYMVTPAQLKFILAHGGEVEFL